MKYVKIERKMGRGNYSPPWGNKNGGKEPKLSKFYIFPYDYNIIFNTLTGYAIKLTDQQWGN